MDARILSSVTTVRTAGIVEQEVGIDRLRLIYAVPCSANGEVGEDTHDEYVELADELFEKLLPGQELA